jgi:nucleotide-binding universal stress UspA family protein
MAIRNILVPIFQGVDFQTQLDAALQLGRKEPAHIDAVFVRPDPATLATALPDMLIAAGITIENIEGEGREAGAKARAAFEDWRLANDVPLDSTNLRVCNASWREQVASVEKVIVEVGRLSDLIILTRPDSFETATQRAFDAAVFDTGRPTLILPKDVPGDLLRHVVIAWNSSIEATRAVAGAMPLLRQAKQVSIFTAPAHTDEAIRDLYLGEQLAWHGIRSHYLSPDVDTHSVGAALLEAVGTERATMIVMGAYTHSRIREMLLGGVTRHILRHAAIPVLMMH